MKTWHRFAGAILTPILFFAGLYLTGNGFGYIENFRKLERIPPTSVSGSVGGEVQLHGTAVVSDQKTLKTPHIGTKAVYYRYLLEEEYKDSDGDTQWRTVKDITKAVRFFIQDNSGKALLDTGNQSAIEQIDWQTESHRQTRGRYRHTEWIISPGETLTVVGVLRAPSRPDKPAEVTFTAKGDYVPIISEFSMEHARSSLGSEALLSIWGGVTAFVFMALCLMLALKKHRVLIYLSLMTLSTMLLLLQLGMQSLKLNVADGAERVRSNTQMTANAANDLLARNGLTDLARQVNKKAFSTDSPEFSGFSKREKQQLNNWRMTAYEVRQRYLNQIRYFPESWYAASTGADQLPEIPLPADLKSRADISLANMPATRVRQHPFYLMLGAIIMALSAWIGFRTVRFKRMQENIVATPVAGVAYGLAETNGELITLDEETILEGPLSGRDCCWYHYKVEEKRGSGKDSKWVTIKDEKRSVDFRCKDGSGDIYIDSDDAEFITRHKEFRSTGGRRYTEKSIRPGDMLYIFGEAQITPESKGDELCFSEPDDAPFIISNYGEEDVKFLKGMKGLFMLCVAISIMFLGTLWIGGNQGSFSALDFLLASLAAPGLSLLMMLIFMFNDLVFLNNRCDRNFANIQIALKKRFDLTPQLLRVAKEYLRHERDLMKQLAAIRRYSTQENNDDGVQSVNRYLNQHAELLNTATQKISVEDYPDLKGNKTISDLHKRLVHLENEIALIREGFNDAVTQYNTRISLFPDVFLARFFRFGKRKLLG